MLSRLVCLLSFSLSLVSSMSFAEDWKISHVEAEQFQIGDAMAVVAHPQAKKIYVGGRSYDSLRRGLYVFEMGPDGQPSGKPRRFSDHPTALAAGHWSLIQTMLLDVPRRKLWLGLNESHNETVDTLVVYELDEKGEPSGKPRAFASGNPLKATDALVMHPTLPQLCCVGWGGEGFFAHSLDSTGLPNAAPVMHRIGGYGKRTIAFRPDGGKVYLGTYPYVLEVADLDTAGNLVGKARNFPIAGGPQEYLAATVVFSDQRDWTQGGAFVRAPNESLASFEFDGTGEPTGLRTVEDKTSIQALSLSNQPGCLITAMNTGFTDRLTNKSIVNGVRLVEFKVGERGRLTETRASAPLMRRKVGAMGSAPAVALTTSSLGRGFLGNQIRGLQVRATILDVEASDALPPIPVVVPFDDQKKYLRFVYSPRREMVYATSEDALAVHSIKESRVAFVPCPKIVDAVTVDDERGMLYVGLADGRVEMRRFDAAGVPAATGEQFATGLSTVTRLLVHPQLPVVYAFGQTGTGTATGPVVAVPSGSHTNDAVLDVERRRLYVVTSYQGNQNLAVWRLTTTGALDGEPQRFNDNLPIKQTANGQAARGMLSSVRLARSQRRLYVVGHSENVAPGTGGIVVFPLNNQGDPTGSAQLFPARNMAGSSDTIELSADGQWLYESGWGDPRIYAWRLDEQGQPVGEPTKWDVGNFGKMQLTFISGTETNRLLAGTFPNVLETIQLQLDGRAIGGVQGMFQTEKVQAPFGLMTTGVPSPWVNLDDELKGNIGTSVGRVTMSGANVTRARVRFEVARADGDGSPQPVRTFETNVAGPVAAVLLPRYGLDDPSKITANVESSEEHFRRWEAWAEKYAVSPGERPTKFLVANGLIGLDSNPQALQHGMRTLSLLGHNTVQAWNWSGMKGTTIREVGAAHGIKSFRHAVYNPPSYFDYNTDQVAPEFLDNWARGFHVAAAEMGAAPKELSLFHLADEPGWYFPAVLNEVRASPARLAVFHNYLRTKGHTPQTFGKSTWDEVLPLGLSQAKSLSERRLLFWTARFYAESVSNGFAAATAALQRQLHPGVLTTTNLNNWPGRFFVPSPGVKIANNTDTGPDAAEGMPDWFDLGRKRAVTCIWTEDWFGDADAQLWSLYGDLLRCAAREGNIEYGGYVVGQSTGAMPEGAKYKLMALAAHGAKTFDPYIFGPYAAFADGWSEKESAFRGLAEAIRTLGKSERLLFPGRPRDGSVAILFPQASQVWDANATVPPYLHELYGLHAALIHDNYPVDFVDDFGVENGDLEKRRYATLYVTAPCLSAKAQLAIRRWVTGGGRVVLSPKACLADEYNEPTDILSAAVENERVTRFSQWLGAAYWSSPERGDPSQLPQNWSRALRREITAPARAVTARRDAVVTFPHGDQSPEVEAALLESSEGIAITLLNWSGVGLDQIQVTLPLSAEQAKKVTSVHSIVTGPLVAKQVNGSLTVTLPLKNVDVLLIAR